MTTFLDLPIELLPLILNYISKPQFLASCCLVNRDFYHFGIQNLYNKIYIYAWYKHGKAKVLALLKTLAECPQLAKCVHKLELRDFPKAIFSEDYDSLIQSCLKGLSNCTSLMSCAWTRDKTLSTEILKVLSACSSLRELEINGHAAGTYDPRVLLQFSSLSKISLIMPSSEVVNILPLWTGITRDSLVEFQVLCKATSHITDATLEEMAPNMTRLQRLQIAGCPRVTHRGINAILAHNTAGIKTLAIEGLSSSLELSTLANFREKLRCLKYLTLTFPQNAIEEKWTSDFLLLTSQMSLEELNLYLTPTPTKPEVTLTSSFLLTIIPPHSVSLVKLSISRIPVPLPTIGWICETCLNLESFFVMVKAVSLSEIAPELARSKSLRNIHVNFPHTDQTGRVPQSLILDITSQLGSHIEQIGFLNRVYQVQRRSKINETDDVVLERILVPYDQPQIPEQFLVLKA